MEPAEWMLMMDTICLAMSAGLLVYLFVALLKPENFS
jgi:K+-transporting ATPase KdpF subunit